MEQGLASSMTDLAVEQGTARVAAGAGGQAQVGAGSTAAGSVSSSASASSIAASGGVGLGVVGGSSSSSSSSSILEQRRRSSLTNRVVKGAVGGTQTKTNGSSAGGAAGFGALSGLDNKGAAGQLKMAAGTGLVSESSQRRAATSQSSAGAGAGAGAAVFDDSRGLNSEAVPVSDRKPDRLKFYDRSNSKVGDLDERTEDRFTRFNRWMEENGALTPDLYMHKYTENVRGVHAMNEIDPHRQLVLIPKKCLIMETMGRETPIGAKVGC